MHLPEPGPCERRRAEARAAGPGGGAAGPLCEGRRGALRSASLPGINPCLRRERPHRLPRGWGGGVPVRRGGAELPLAAGRAASERECSSRRDAEGGGGAETRLRGLRGRPGQRGQHHPRSPGVLPGGAGRARRREAAGRGFSSCSAQGSLQSIVSSRAGSARVTSHTCPDTGQSAAHKSQGTVPRGFTSLCMFPSTGCVLPCLQALAGREAPT